MPPTVAPPPPRRTPPALLVALLAIAVGLAAITFVSTRALFGRAARLPAATATVPVNPALDASAAPGAGVLAGRLVDADTGLPIADAGITLVGPNRRALSGPDGRFRFDSVPPGPVTLAFGPVEGYVPRTVVTRAAADGLDLGITPLLRVAAPTLIVPEYGGGVAGCDDTMLTVASAALTEPAALSLTCVKDAADFPAAPPSGRLPLAVVDAAPALVVPNSPARLTVTLPAQPRYGAGVVLDLLRLDLDRLTWQPAGQLLVDPGGRTASGSIAQLGTYLLTTPPFGQFGPSSGSEAQVFQSTITGRPDGGPVDVFPPDTPLVYAGFDYARMDNSPILVRTVDAEGETLFEARRPYSGDGHDAVPMPAPDNKRWPIGAYITTVYVGEPPVSAGDIAWRVAASPTPTPAPRIYSVSPDLQAAMVVPLPPPGVGGCPQPLAWWAAVVQPGDNLSALALRTRSSVAELMVANCLTSDKIRAGQVVYVPQPPVKAPLYPPPAYKKPPVYQPWPTAAGPTDAWATIAPPAVVPTMPPPVIGPTTLPGFPEATPWKLAPPPAGWTQAPPAPLPTWPPAPAPVYPTDPPFYPTSAPAPPPAALPPVSKWTPVAGPEPTLAPRPTGGP